MRTLYLPIHIPGTYHDRSQQNKHTLRDALHRLRRASADRDPRAFGHEPLRNRTSDAARAAGDDRNFPAELFHAP